MIGYSQVRFNQNNCESYASNYYQSDKNETGHLISVNQACKISCKHDKQLNQ